MARKRYTPEEIIQHLRTAELEQSKGAKQEEAARKIGVTPVTFSRWKSEFGVIDGKYREMKRYLMKC